MSILSIRDSRQSGGDRKVTCSTCKLKGCVGRCQWTTVARPRPTKAA